MAGRQVAGRSGWTWAVAGLIFSLAFFGCSQSEPIPIGFTGGTSGRVADLGIAGRDGAQLAVDLRIEGLFAIHLL